MSFDPKYPDIEVQLSGEDGNSMMIVGRVRRAMRINGVPNKEIDAFTEDAMSGNYDHVLQTCMKWVTTR